MRFLATILIAASLLGAVAWCQFSLTREVRVDVTRGAEGHGGHAHRPDSDGIFRLEITPTFSAGDDPFAVRLDPAAATPRVQVRHGDRLVLNHTADVRRHERIVVEDVTFPGDRVELFVQATPAPADARHTCALRLRLFTADGAMCDDVTLWSEGGGQNVAGTVTLGLHPRLRTLDRGLGKEGP